MVMLSVDPLSLASEIRFWLTSERFSAREEERMPMLRCKNDFDEWMES